MTRIRRLIVGAFLPAVTASCFDFERRETPPVNWVLHDRNATERPLDYLASKPNAYAESGFNLFNRDRVQPGVGRLQHRTSVGLLPDQLRYHWTFGEGDHWRFDDIHPFRLIPSEVIERSRGFEAPPLLIRITFLPKGRLRFSWHACADASCRERGSPSLRFSAEHEFQGVPAAEAPATGSSRD
ncbi:MAG: hypothetical protein AB7G13_30780 [Lautropia sp.]